MEPMWFYDEADDLEAWYACRRQAQGAEAEHLRVRIALRELEAALRADPGNTGLQTKAEQLKERLQELERTAPWISSDVPFEILLWGVPHG